METKSKQKLLILLIIILLILIISLICLKSISLKKEPQSEKPNSEPSTTPETELGQEIKYDDYIYKITTSYSDDSTKFFIYLLPNNILKVVKATVVYKVMDDCNCMMPTDQYRYEEEELNFSEVAKSEVIKVFEELSHQSGQKEILVDLQNLTTYQQIVLNAIFVNDEDMITFDKDLEYVEDKATINHDNATITNTLRTINAQTNNKILNKIANYLNEIAESDFEKINDYSATLNNLTIDSGVNLNVFLVGTSPSNISFLYIKEGNLGTEKIYEKKGYNFDYNGDVKEFDADGFKQSFYEQALENFMKSPVYLNHSSELNKDWQNVIYNNMFLLGNWYLNDDFIYFIIPVDKLGLPNQKENEVVIPVKNNQAI